MVWHRPAVLAVPHDQRWCVMAR